MTQECNARPEVRPDGTEKLPSVTDFVTDALASELGDTYDCIRVWEAWSVGTMRSDDFLPTDARADEIAVTVVKKLLEHPAIKRALALEDALANFPSLRIGHGPFDPVPLTNWCRQYILPLHGLPTLKENIDVA